MSVLVAFVGVALLSFAPPTPAGNQEAKPRGDAVSSVDAPREGSDPSVGLWLVDLARHQGHLVGRTDPRSASLHVLAILKAAVECSPNCADAFYWLYDIENRLGRFDSAREALSRYVQLNPADEAARNKLLDLQWADLQTAEARQAFMEEQVRKPGISRFFESEARCRLARMSFERRENGAAAREIEKSLRLNPMNIGARQLAFEIFSETEPSLQRIEMMLQLISVNPSQINLVWDLGDYLESLSMHTRAQEWYRRAIDLHGQSNAGPVPAEYWYKLAVSYLNAGDYPQCLEAADAALKIKPDLLLGRQLRATAYSRTGKLNESTSEIEYITQAYETQMPGAIESGDHDLAAQIAWFFSFHSPNAAKSLKMAEFAMKAPDPSSLARLAFGYALRLNGRTDEAVAVLKPLAGSDQLAALELAKIQIEHDKKGEAFTTLHKAATLQYDGIAFELIADLLRKNGETPPVLPKYTRITEALDRFNRDVFDYYKRPRDFLNVTMKFADESLPDVGPIRVIFRMENVGPFPITFGEGFMTRPLVAVSAKLNGHADPAYENFLQVLLNTRPTLLPGDAVEKTVTINVGPIQQAIVRRSTEPLQIRLMAMLDPVITDGKLSSGPGTVVMTEINGTRPPIDVSEAGIKRMTDLAVAADASRRMLAADRIGAVLASIEAADRKSSLAALSVSGIRSELAGLMSDEAWPVRAHAVVAAGWSHLEPQAIAMAASPLVRNENPIVRMLAVRLFAQQHGEKFKKVLEQMAVTDSSEVVRLMAASFLPDYRASTDSSAPVIPASARGSP